MAYKIVVLIRTDPEKSHRAGEGIRIALGLAAGDHQVEVILADRAPLLLTPDLHEYVDGEITEKFLASLKDFIPVFLIAKESANKLDLSESDYPIQLFSKDEIAAKIAAADRFMVF